MLGYSVVITGEASQGSEEPVSYPLEAGYTRRYWALERAATASENNGWRRVVYDGTLRHGTANCIAYPNWADESFKSLRQLRAYANRPSRITLFRM